MTRNAIRTYGRSPVGDHARPIGRRLGPGRQWPGRTRRRGASRRAHPLLRLRPRKDAAGAAQKPAPAPPSFTTTIRRRARDSAIPDGQPVETHQKITLNGESLAYTARAGYMPLRNATTGQSEAHLFYTCYAKDGVTDASARPLLFFLGGAPGVAATWQEFGGLGPKRMKWANDGTAGMPPYAWVDNPHTLLGQADLVFVNPGGHRVQPSRPAGPGPELLEYCRRHRFTGRVRAQFPQYAQSPEFAALSGGRGFWHGAGGGSGRLSQRTPDPRSWRGAALDDDERRCARRRRAIHHAAAEPDHGRLAPQETRAGIDRDERRTDFRTGAPVCVARVSARALQGRPHDAGGTHQGNRRTCRG